MHVPRHRCVGGGKHTLDGGGGHDLLIAGKGSDTFVFKGLNYEGSVIEGFKLGQDHLDLHQALVSLGYTGTDPVADHYLKFMQNGADTEVLVEPNGDPNAKAH